MTGFPVGARVVYPSHGVGVIENVEERSMGTARLACYMLRLADHSLVMVPVNNAATIGLRPPLTAVECETLFRRLAEDFAAPANDWKDRFKDFSERMKTGDLFAIASVCRDLTFLSKTKALSFREQMLLEKAQYLVVSELALVCCQPECDITERLQQTLAAAFAGKAQSLAAGH